MKLNERNCSEKDKRRECNWRSGESPIAKVESGGNTKNWRKIKEIVQSQS